MSDPELKVGDAILTIRLKITKIYPYVVAEGYTVHNVRTVKTRKKNV